MTIQNVLDFDDSLSEQVQDTLHASADLMRELSSLEMTAVAGGTGLASFY